MAGNENGAAPVLLSKADLDRLRLEQQEWSRLSVRRRVTVIGRAAGWLVENFETIAEAIEVPHPRPVEQTLAAELLPLADAIRFVERQAARILSTRTLSKGDRPLWTGNVKVRVARDPLGIVLVLGTWNYPLFLTGVHVVQALAAGNGVLLKPAPGAERVSELFCRSLWESGVPRRLLQLLPSGVEHARNAMDLGVDRVVLTGSSLTGRRVLGQLVETLTPATLELSGCDAMFVLSTADLNRVCDAILLGLRLNGSATCIAPRRVLIMPDQLGPLQTRLKERLQFATRIKVFPAAFKLLKQLAHEAISEGAEVLCGDVNDFDRDSEMLPLVMTGVRPEMRLVQSDLFAPVVSLIMVNDWAEAIAADRRCPYALSASVFGATDEAEQRAMQVEAGCVVINDCIVPTADPRVPFGGRGESGYGMTRGAEGLLEMTRLKSICVRKGNWVPHLEPPHKTDRSILTGLFKLQHGATWRKRWEGMKEIWKSIRERQAE